MSVCTRSGQHVDDRVGPYQPQVPRAEFGLGVILRLAYTCIGVPGPSLGNPPVVLVFSLGLCGVPGEGPVAGQLFMAASKKTGGYARWCCGGII
jgi:hypothetical protein